MRALAFVLGFLFFGAILAAGQLVMPGLPVPAAFGLFVIWLLAGRPWVPWGYVGTVTVGAAALWLVDQPTTKMPVFLLRLAPLMTQTGLVLAAVCAILTVTRLRKAPPPAQRALPALALLFVLTMLVASFSGNAGGADPMRQWFMEVAHFSTDQAHLAVLAIRKSIHFTFYFCVGFAATAAARSGGETPQTGRGIGLGFGFALAAFDEMRQSNVDTRSGSAWDVGLDMLGVLAGSAVALRMAARASRRPAPS